MTSTEILRAKSPGDLFPRDPVLAKKKYHELARLWHPDAAGSAEVFDHIKKLYDKAVKALDEGLVWDGGNSSHIETVSKKHYDLHYFRKHTFELGVFYVGEKHVTYLVDKEHRDLFKNALAKINKLDFPSKKVEKEMAGYLPMKHTAFELSDGRLGLQIIKDKELILLRDVVDHAALDPKHVAWIVSRLHNLACYLHVSGLVHHEISLDTVFISPPDHGAALLGGWWYAKHAGSALKKVSKRTYGLLPWKSQVEKKATRLTDSELVRATGRELMGGRKTPKAVITYLSTVASGNAIKNFEEWSAILEKSFGPRRFTELKLTPEEIYK